ncbi:MAG: hypothetical protein JNL79_13375 [Myxococcales bacterium]|nr:hypothetical protein [Myxococcales bacterium]
MTDIVRCVGCGIVREAHEGACSECGTTETFRGRSRYALAGFLGSAGLAITLAACYGGPSRPVPKEPQPEPSTSASASESASPTGSTPTP